MSWNYRVIHKSGEGGHGFLNYESYDIREVYYAESGRIDGWSADPSPPYGETGLELLESFRNMQEAFSRPILHEVDGKLVEHKEGS